MVNEYAAPKQEKHDPYNPPNPVVKGASLLGGGLAANLVAGATYGALSYLLVPLALVGGYKATKMGINAYRRFLNHGSTKTDTSNELSNAEQQISDEQLQQMKQQQALQQMMQQYAQQPEQRKENQN